MAKTETDTARGWVLNLPFSTWFWRRDVPGRSEIVDPVLSRLAKDPKLGVTRVGHGLYWRGYPEGQALYGVNPPYDTAALLLAGAGSGFAGWSALNKLTWTLQSPPKHHISVVGRVPTPPSPIVVYAKSSNKRRIDLNWAEVTVLEALKMFKFTEEPWNECLDRLTDGSAASRLNWRMGIDPFKLQWAVRNEKHVTPEMLYRIDEMTACAVGGLISLQ